MSQVQLTTLLCVWVVGRGFLICKALPLEAALRNYLNWLAWQVSPSKVCFLYRTCQSPAATRTQKVMWTLKHHFHLGHSLPDCHWDALPFVPKESISRACVLKWWGSADAHGNSRQFLSDKYLNHSEYFGFCKGLLRGTVKRILVSLPPSECCLLSCLCGRWDQVTTWNQWYKGWQVASGFTPSG